MTSIPTTAAFDALAPFYERHWGRAFLDNSISLFRRKLSPKLQRADPVLDLCCGTGHFSEWLAKQGYQVIGLDSSRAMLEYARKRLSRGRLFQGDVRHFRLPQRFKAVVCFYNSLNQFLDSESFRAVLASCFRHLEPGGWFLFDIVLEHGYVEYWETDEALADGDEVCELRYRFDHQQSVATCLVTLVSIHGSYSRRSELVFRQRPYTLPFVAEELEAAGFQVVVVKPVRDCNPPDGRVAILARRPPDSTDSASAASSILPHRCGTEPKN
jgi:SAM-dependent methyltransferase